MPPCCQKSGMRRITLLVRGDPKSAERPSSTSVRSAQFASRAPRRASVRDSRASPWTGRSSCGSRSCMHGGQQRIPSNVSLGSVEAGRHPTRPNFHVGALAPKKVRDTRQGRRVSLTPRGRIKKSKPSLSSATRDSMEVVDNPCDQATQQAAVGRARCALPPLLLAPAEASPVRLAETARLVLACDRCCADTSVARASC